MHFFSPPLPQPGAPPAAVPNPEANPAADSAVAHLATNASEPKNVSPPPRVAIVCAAGLASGLPAAEPAMINFATLTLDVNTLPDAALQRDVELIDAQIRTTLGMKAEQSSFALLDLRTGRLALLRADNIFYAASVPKIAILLGWFDAHPQPEETDAATRHELGLMIKQSSNELAAKYSQLLTLAGIRRTLDRYALYDATHGGGLWLGKHYSNDSERVVDPVGGHSHAATARQVLRFYLLLEQGKLVSPAVIEQLILTHLRADKIDPPLVASV